VTSEAGLDTAERVLGGRYRLLSRIADGGMATVYLALDQRLGRRVAVKILRPDLARDAAFVARFHREAQLAAGLSHPNIVAVHDFEETDSELYLVMEYVEGQTLRQRLTEHGAMTVREATGVFGELLGALAAAHRAQLVHRDVKPENVLLAHDGTIKVTDFGLARAVTSTTRTSTTGVLLGTVSYLAPEQLDADRADARSDVYAAGLVLYELLTGQKAFQGDNPMHVAYQHVHGTVPLASDRVSTVPLELDRVIERATRRDPADRPADAGELLELLQEGTAQLSDEELDATPVFLGGMPVAASAAPGAPAAAAESAVDEPAGGSAAALGPVGGVAVDSASPPTTKLSTLAPTTAYRLVEAEPAPAEAPHDTEPTAPSPQPGRPEASPTPTATRRRRRRWPWVLAVLLLAGGGAGGWWWWDGLGPGSMRTVPVVAHLPLAQAQAALGAVELHDGVTEVYSETEPKGQVIGSDPAAGAEVHKRTGVALQVSKGPERYAVPQLVGVARPDVDKLLTDRNLKLGTATDAFSETVPAGQVISQDPVLDTSVKRDTPVNIVVSKGREPIPVPNLTGKDADASQKQLEGLGLKVTRGDPVNSETVPAGSIITQTPADGTLFKGDAVTIVVSKGPLLVAVPDVTLKGSAEASKILTDAGFKVVINKVFGGVLKTVRFQDPAGGTMVRKGTTITLTVI